jgi:hypothetical protein
MDGMELLTDVERVRLVAGLGLMVFRAREIDPQSAALLLKLSSIGTQVWVQQGRQSWRPE